MMFDAKKIGLSQQYLVVDSSSCDLLRTCGRTSFTCMVCFGTGSDAERFQLSLKLLSLNSFYRNVISCVVLLTDSDLSLLKFNMEGFER